MIDFYRAEHPSWPENLGEELVNAAKVSFEGRYELMLEVLDFIETFLFKNKDEKFPISTSELERLSEEEE